MDVETLPGMHEEVKDFLRVWRRLGSKSADTAY